MPIDYRRIQAICFDVDGTLSDTDDQFVHKLVKIIRPIHSIRPGSNILGMARKIVMLSEGPGNWAYNLADKIGMDGFIVALGDLIYQMGIGKSSQPFQIMQGAREMLVELHKNYALGIISARGERSTLRFLHQFELAHFFKAIATGQTCRHTKPYPDPLRWVAARMGVTTQACLMVGDTKVDILCGKKAGAQTVGVLCGFGERGELIRAGADATLDNTAELAELLKPSRND